MDPNKQCEILKGLYIHASTLKCLLAFCVYIIKERTTGTYIFVRGQGNHPDTGYKTTGNAGDWGILEAPPLWNGPPLLNLAGHYHGTYCQVFPSFKGSEKLKILCELRFFEKSKSYFNNIFNFVWIKHFLSKIHIYNLLKIHEHIQISLYDLTFSNLYKYWMTTVHAEVRKYMYMPKLSVHNLHDITLSHWFFKNQVNWSKFPVKDPFKQYWTKNIWIYMVPSCHLKVTILGFMKRPTLSVSLASVMHVYIFSVSLPGFLPFLPKP